MTDLVEQVAKKVRQLPATQQREVLTFVEFLQHKHVQIDDIAEDTWLAVASKNPVLEFLHNEAEDVYGLQDGKPYTP